MFNNFLNSFNQRPYETQNNKSEFERYMVQHIQGKHEKVSHPFHVDCQVTQRKICYCKSSSEQLMDKKSRLRHTAIASYLKDYYSGIQDEDYKIAFKNVQMHKERIENLQERQDLDSLVPKLAANKEKQNLIEEQKIIEIQKEEQAKQQALQGLEQGICYLCQKTHSFSYYEVFEKKRLYILCHDCCTLTRPNIIARKHVEDILLHKRGKIPVHLRDLKEKLKRKRAQKNLQLSILLEEDFEAKIEQQYKESLEKQKLKQESNNSKKDSQNEEIEDEDDDRVENQEKQNMLRNCQNEHCFFPEEKKQFISCTSCDRTWHPGCMDPPQNYNLVKRFEWFCNECKLCVLCWKNGNEDQLLMCDCCDRAFHTECRDPPITHIPEGKWFCDDCENCASCNNVLLTNLNFNHKIQEKYSQQTIDSKLICDSCWAFYERKEYCPVCHKIVENDEEGNYVCCDVCSLWIHFKCEKLSEKQTKEVKNLPNYTCKKCKSNQEKEEAINKLQNKINTEHPVETAFQYHAAKRASVKPTIQDNVESQQNLQESINTRRRATKVTNYQEYDESDDSLLQKGNHDDDYKK